jgi:ABC-type multidrug transport system ATPase subunit
MLQTSECVEECASDLPVGVSIRGLRKVFPAADAHSKPVVAVNSLNLDLHEGQIFSLLGHNGAGKTTTMSMLVGFTAPTNGDALIQVYLHSSPNQLLLLNDPELLGNLEYEREKTNVINSTQVRSMSST